MTPAFRCNINIFEELSSPCKEKGNQSCKTIYECNDLFLIFILSRYRKKDNGDGYEERRKWPLEELKVS